MGRMELVTGAGQQIRGLDPPSKIQFQDYFIADQQEKRNIVSREKSPGGHARL
jgi:hypothetical protein